MIPHEPLVCRTCKASLNGMAQASEVRERPTGHLKDVECFTVCGYCGAIYASRTTPEDIEAGKRAVWKFVPDDAVIDPELRQLSEKAKRGEIALPLGAKPHRRTW
jgi:hypothetical protein